MKELHIKIYVVYSISVNIVSDFYKLISLYQVDVN